MSPNERRQLTRDLPADLTPEEVVIRHGNGMLGPSYACWYVTVRGVLVPGYYTPDDAAVLRKQILEVSKMRAMFNRLEAQPLPVTTWCPLCGALDTAGNVCAPCVEAYQLGPVPDPTDDSDLLNYHNRY